MCLVLSGRALKIIMANSELSNSSELLGTLGIFPVEILELIVSGLEDFVSVVSWMSASRCCRSLVSEIRVAKDRVLRSSFLTVFPCIRRVHGPILLDSLDDLEHVSDSLNGPLKIWLPGSVGRKEEGWSAHGLLSLLEGEMKEGDESLAWPLSRLVKRVVEVVIERMQRYPEHVVAVHLSKLLRIRWRKDRGTIRVPSSFVSCRGSRDGYVVIANAFYRLLRLHPVSHLSCLLFSLNSKGGTTFDREGTGKFLLDPSISSHLTSFTIHMGFNNAAMSRLQGSRDGTTAQSCFPLVRTIRLLVPEIRDSQLIRTREALDAQSHLWSFEWQPAFRDQITTIEGPLYLYPKRSRSGGSITPLPIHHFPNVRSWNVLFCSWGDLFAFDQRALSDLTPFHVSSREELRTFLTTLLASITERSQQRTNDYIPIDDFCDFWTQYHETHDLHLWYRE